MGGGFQDNKDKLVMVDPSALLEALMSQQRRDRDHDHDFVDLDEVKQSFSSGGGQRGQLRPDSPPKDIHVGAINPYALAEALLGRKIERNWTSSSKILSNVLQTDYDELFDMKYHSVLYAGLKLNDKERKAEKFDEKEMRLLKERDLETPDLSYVRQLEDLKKLGLKDMENVRVKMAHIQNGKMCLVLDAHQVAKTVSNRDVTYSVNELATPFRLNQGQWMPPNSSWRDMYDYFFRSVKQRVVGGLANFHIGEGKHTFHAFDDPIQGCTGNSWLIAALFSVFWSDPSAINRATRVQAQKDEQKRLYIKFHDKGGENNGRTETVEVNYEIPINNSNNEPLYARSSDGADIWPSLYEKAFAKWVTGNSSQQPDITQTSSGDPIKAMAQINGREPFYYLTEKHDAYDLVGLIRSNCLNFKTINPMTAWTHATGHEFKGSNIVANHAYSVLGYTIIGEKQYIILRNPWGVTEPYGLNSYPGLLERVDPMQWYPASMLDLGGVFGIEPHAFKQCFACVGVAKEDSKRN